MDVGRMGSLALRALEPMLHGDEIAFFFKFRDNYDPDRLWASFDSLVRQNPALQVVLNLAVDLFHGCPSILPS